MSSGDNEGDYNFNGYVEGDDFLLWQRTLDQTGIGLPADGNGNEVVDQADLEIWQNNYGGTVPSQATFSIVSIPEPNTLLLTGLAIGSLLCKRRF